MGLNIYCAEFAAAQQDILDHGYSRNVKTVSGDLMPRVNPSVDRRDTAQKIILEMAKRFGLTPLDQFALVGHQAALPAGGLFGAQPAASVTPSAPASAPREQNLIGMLDQLDSVPPGSIQ